MLPTQTVDLEGRVWRVVRWVDPVPLQLDEASVRAALLDAVAPWAVHGNDGGLDAELRAGATVEIVAVHKERGVVVEPFPRQWRCRSCERISTERVQTCRCGSTSIAQMQHVAFHSCGALDEPRVPRCEAHREVAVRLPGTARAQEMYFYCPECRRKLSQGFPFQRCRCGAPNGMKRNVHRASEVFSPHYAVVVNPPDPSAATQLRAGGGGARALEWVLAGLGPTPPGDGRQTVEGLVETLIQSGLSLETARELAERAHARGEVARADAQERIDLPPNARHRAQEEAFSLASALGQGRVRIDDMVENTTPPLRTLYERSYRGAIADAALSDVQLLTNFPVATLAFGFTRGGDDPKATVLRPFRERGRLRAYGMLAKTEAILFRLDPVRVLHWMRNQGLTLPEARDPRGAHLAILRAIDIPRPSDQHSGKPGAVTLTLLHSYAHRLIRVLAVTAGAERDSLAEYLLPHLLSVIVYASARGQFVLGALQAVFETDLHRLLEEFVHGETRCPLDPGCRSAGGACMACLHLGEPSCRWFNRFLDRKVLFGDRGFLRTTR
jgi:hypothetical protein